MKDQERDEEIEAMTLIVVALAPLELDAQQRVLRYMIERFRSSFALGGIPKPVRLSTVDSDS